MPQMTITPAGYAAVQEAIRTGVLIQPETYRVGNNNAYNLLSQLSDIQGSMVYEGAIESVVVLNQHAAVFTIRLPAWLEGTIGELALRLGSDIFALGQLDSPYLKARGFLLRLQAYVQCLEIGKAVSTDYSATSPLPKRASYLDLDRPDLELTPVLGILSGQSGYSIRGPAMVVKSHYHDEEARWLMVNGTLAFRGTPLASTSSTFTLSRDDFDGLNHAIAFVHVAAGTGLGQTRAISSYSVVDNEWTVADAFSPELDSTSSIELWAGVGHCFDPWNNDCPDTLGYDPQDPLPTPLPDPEELCSPATPTSTVKPPRRPPTIRGDGPTVLTQPAPHIYTKPRLGVHLSDWPICSPFDEAGRFGVVGSDPDEAWRAWPPIKGFLERLRAANPLWADRVFANRFDPTAARSSVYDRQAFYTPAFADEKIISDPAACKRLIPSTMQGAEGTVWNHIRSTRLAEGSYADLELSAIGALGVPGGPLTSTTTNSGFNVGSRTLDAILIPAYHRLVVYEDKNFRGRILADLEGPIYLFNTWSLAPATLSALQQAQVASGFVSSISQFPQATVSGTEDLWWPLDNAVWAGVVGAAFPVSTRFASTMRLAKANGQPQSTDWLPEPNLRLWRGSARVILL